VAVSSLVFILNPRTKVNMKEGGRWAFISTTVCIPLPPNMTVARRRQGRKVS